MHEQNAALVLPEIIQFAIDFFVFDVAAVVLAQRCSADGTLQTSQVPVQVVDLRELGNLVTFMPASADLLGLQALSRFDATLRKTPN